MKMFLFVFAFTSALLPRYCDLETGWRGIKVFETSRSEVEKLLGIPKKEEDGEVRYETDDAYLRFLYSNGPCTSPTTLLGGFNLKKGIVLQYEVRPKKNDQD